MRDNIFSDTAADTAVLFVLQITMFFVGVATVGCLIGIPITFMNQEISKIHALVIFLPFIWAGFCVWAGLAITVLGGIAHMLVWIIKWAAERSAALLDLFLIANTGLLCIVAPFVS